MDFSSLGFVRVAAIAPPVTIGDPNANRVKIAAWAQEFADAGASVIVFPELSLTGYTCEDLFLTSMVQRAHTAISELAAATASLNATLIVGSPMQAANGRRYNTAVVIKKGQVLGAVPKIHLPNYGEFYERRWFTPGADVDEMVAIGGLEPFRLHARQVFDLGTAGGVVVRMGVEICEDLWAPDQPSSALALAGANLIVNPSASNELIAKSDYRRDLVRIQSARLSCAYIYAGSGPTESTKDVVFGGHCLIAENGSILAESDRFAFAGSSVITDIDIERLANERALNTTFGNAPEPFPAFAVSAVNAEISVMPTLDILRRTYARLPFVPDNPATVHERAKEIMAIQSTGLARRMMAARSERAVLGLSGGLDSTLALLVVLETMKRLGRGPETILCVSMPGLGTTDRTKVSAAELARCAGVEFREIPIAAAVHQHFADIGHDPETFDVVYENSQARERTQILFDIANQVKGIVVGTGDLSELALGWCTYNADHMANYGVNGSVPKTLVKHLVRWYGDNCGDDAMNAVLDRILDTIISPELLPAGAKGEIVHSTEDIVGPYELHDFFLYHRQRNGFGPAKIRALAIHTFSEVDPDSNENPYDEATINKWIRVFFERFARQQFKRTTLPPGPKVGSVSLSPRGDLRMPDEIDPAAWLAELD
jgi:NAD+ synthase (glutamine-hydrolysing)